jgi:hypothetical protein
MDARPILSRRAVLAGLQALVAGGLIVSTAGPGLAASLHGASTSTPTGNDISYPQCGRSFPTAPAFAIVGLNGGLANTLNRCFGPSSSYPSYAQSELYWAVATATGATTQPKASLYMNTADPGNVYNGTVIADWPVSSTSSDPYGACMTTTVTTSSGTHTVGQNSQACAWQYGDNRAAQDATWLSSAATAINAQESAHPVSKLPGNYPWWLDVETGNTWQSGSSGQAMNVADMQGMVYALQAVGAAKIGAYSTSYQWGQITGTTALGTLSGIPDWIPGASTLSAAKSNCKLAAFTGGRVVVTQWFGHRFDGDFAC